MTDPIFSLWDIIAMAGYPIAAWLSWKAGQNDGIQSTVDALKSAGMLDESFGESPEEDEE